MLKMLPINSLATICNSDTVWEILNQKAIILASKRTNRCLVTTCDVLGNIECTFV